jgi:pyruvate dehydrogenase E1 component
MDGSAPFAAIAWCRSGPDRFGQGGDIPDLYHEYGLDTDAIVDACVQALLG